MRIPDLMQTSCDDEGADLIVPVVVENVNAWSGKDHMPTCEIAVLEEERFADVWTVELQGADVVVHSSARQELVHIIAAILEGFLPASAPASFVQGQLALLVSPKHEFILAILRKLTIKEFRVGWRNSGCQKARATSLDCFRNGRLMFRVCRSGRLCSGCSLFAIRQSPSVLRLRRENTLSPCAAISIPDPRHSFAYKQGAHRVVVLALKLVDAWLGHVHLPTSKAGILEQEGLAVIRPPQSYRASGIVLATEVIDRTSVVAALFEVRRPTASLLLTSRYPRLPQVSWLS
eukprot:TRINITY_DN7215_c0_g1_i1.p1 TRINITY_DN7215_c0_g1~~TRINITY_DN7215_c0_g1_i1.p1  ORF type:complete len:290 (-),score=12.78 TRINITY_DN7215_c0_g1_i1:315-1184(-)